MSTLKDYLTDKVFCPYCGEIVEIDREDFSYDEDDHNEFECEHCEKTFKVTVKIEYKFRTSLMEEKGEVNTVTEQGLKIHE